MEFSEFRKKVLKVEGVKKKFKATNSYKLRDIYRILIRDKMIPKTITEKHFGIIIKTINKYYQDNIIEGLDFNIPYMLGRLELRKNKARVLFKNGKLVSNLPVDWYNTLKLWNEDKFSYTNKTLVRREPKEIFKVYYSKQKAKYNNKTFFEFTPTRSFKLRLKKEINNNNVDALMLYRI